MAETVIDIQALTKSYNGVKAVDQLSLQIKRGEIFGLLGPNGAGKSTTILMLLGLSEPDEGSINVLGLDPAREPIPVKRKVGYLPDDVGFYEDRTGLENLVLTARLNQVPEAEAKERAYQLLESVGLQHAAHKKTGAYSRGMRQRLGLADVLIKAPEIIILDEPTLGIDPKGMDELLALIRSLSEEQGLTVLLSSHQLHQVQQICDRVGLFVRGRLLAEGNIASLSRSLFADDPLQITVESGPLNHGLLERIRAIPGVRHAEPADGDGTDLAAASAEAESAGRSRMIVGSDTDCSDAIARMIIEDGVALFGLQRKEYGLDEIYHRYFEGGEQHEQGSSRPEAQQA
ncbi:ABC transporter ATP-binding protein [Paenibacillus woosongensis]|uniref:ABC transporter ATP-binding protein n=1 Tax=Paenibacillus woosongensis TaxID=307580 RepID=A0ABQ4MN72_9BACL|nr:ABC transporter ATP-binding protein [Paenibacillus woosongensis]GIP57456.1 ABC transporter ATP-binding protein [Paenibacillus woosongensis]